MPSLFIDGQWVASGDGTCSQVINPSDATVVTEVDVATDEQVQQAIAAARRAFDTTDWPRTPTGERAALLDRVAALLDRDLEALAVEETQNTGKAMRESRWDIADVARVFRYYAQLADKDGRPPRRRRATPTPSRRIVYEPVGVCALIAPWNYPLLQLSWKIAPGPRGGQHRGHEAGPGHAADRDPPHEAPRGGRHAARGRQPRPRSGRPRRPGARRLPGRRPDLADRRHRRRPRPAPGRGRQHQARRPRARRQEPEHRLRRRRLRDRRRQRAHRGVHPFGPGLLGRLPGDRRGRDLRPVRRRGRAARRPDPHGPRQRRRDRSRRAHHRRAPRQGRGLRQERASTKAPASSPAAAAPTSRTSRTASSTAPRSSPTSGATCASSARRSSARS